jgi:hypothetical protein
MHNYISKNIPLVAIYNYFEGFYEFFRHYRGNMPIIEKKRCKGDTALLWLGESKLVVTSYAIAHPEYFVQNLGYQETKYICPKNPSEFLSLDILNDPDLIHQLLEYIGSAQTVQLVPYATTSQFLQLAEALKTRYQINVLLPESPDSDDLWVKNYIDTKVGFHTLCSRWLPDAALIPPGIICRTLEEAAETACWFNRNNEACIVKPNAGGSGLGLHIFHPEDAVSAAQILQQLKPDTFLNDELIIVEKFIISPSCVSPSAEVFVPRAGSGEPELTYISNQLFSELGMFSGVLISHEILKEKWYAPLAESALIIGQNLQKMGYAGHFDLDAIVDDTDQIFLLETNARRTGGTHAHEFGCFFFGPDYLDKIVLLSQNTMNSGEISTFDELLKVIGDLLYPMQKEQKGVIITITSSLVLHEFGCIIAAASTEEALELQQRLRDRF